MVKTKINFFQNPIPRWFATAILTGAALFVLGLIPKAFAATYTVDTTADETDDGECVSDTTLREAISCADNNIGADTISFSVTGTISPASGLPPITEQVTINGSGNITIDGTSAGTSDGLVINNNNSIITGLIIQNFSSDSKCGIKINEDSNTIGGDTAAERNVLSDNDTGICITNTAANNVIIGNYIGTTSTGNVGASNTKYGIQIQGATGNTIGGTNSGEGNVISSNDMSGIYITCGGTPCSDGSTTTIIGNYIGVKADGTGGLGNGENGILFDTAGASNVVGGATSAHRNIISGNAQDGIRIYSTTNAVTVQGNYIGLNPAGTAAMANSSDGIQIDTGSQNHAIGGSSSGQGNVISGNTQNGIIITGANSNSNTVIGNYIGLNAAGTAAIANSTNGIRIESSAQSNTVGGTTSAERNYISGNTQNGVSINNSNCNTIKGNYIGLDINGDDVGNTLDGINIANGAQSNTIGGTTSGSGNVISGNDQDGVDITGSNTSSNALYRNYIGTNTAGTAAKANTVYGLYINTNASSNTIGSANNANVISGNTDSGMRIDSSNSNTVQGNYIGVDAAGTSALANGGKGLELSGGSQSNTIGGSSSGQGNIISKNTSHGIYIYGANTNSNTIYGNFIGTGSAKTENLGNGAEGIMIENGTSNTIGGITSGQDNYIQNNTNSGVKVFGSTTRATIRGNSIKNHTADGEKGIALQSSANEGISITGTTITTSTTSEVSGTSDLADSTTVDVYTDDVDEGEIYEGTTTISSGTFTLNTAITAGKKATVVATNANGSTSEFSAAVTVTTDSTAPSAPTVTSSTDPTTNASYTFTGTKEAYSSILNNSTEIVAINSSTTWSWSTTLTEGSNSFSFTSKDYSDNTSAATLVSITLDTIAPSAPVVSSGTTSSAAAYTFTGTKEASTSIRVSTDGTTYSEAYALDSGTTWTYGVTLSEGSNTYYFKAKDEATNESSATQHTVTYTTTVTIYSGGGGGGSGSGSTAKEIAQAQLEEAKAEEEKSETLEEEETLEEASGREGEAEAENEAETISITGEAEAEEEVETEETKESETETKISEESLPETVPVETVPVEEITVTYYTPEKITVEEEEMTEEEKSVETLEKIVSESNVTIVSELVSEEDQPENEDKDELPDWYEETYFGDTEVSSGSEDIDKDGVSDSDEYTLGTDPTSEDSDQDGINDGEEIALGTSGSNWDSDGDGLSDSEEITLGTDPTNKDTDGDGYQDGAEVSYGGGQAARETEKTPEDEDQNGVDDAWVERNKIVIGEGESIGTKDSDQDGLSDFIEYQMNTDPQDKDTDRDGVLDSEEILDYGTNPRSYTNLAQIPVKVTNFKDGDTTSDPQLLVKGTASSGLIVQIFAVNSRGVQKQISKVWTDDNSKFVALSNHPLLDGTYYIFARAATSAGQISGESYPVQITIDSSLNVSQAKAEKLADQEITDEVIKNLKIIQIQDLKPVLYGIAEIGHRVEISWHTLLFSSVILADTIGGEFTASPPSELKLGSHEVYLYTIREEDGARSKSLKLNFEISKAEKRGAALEKTDSLIKLSLILFLIIFIGGGVGFRLYQKKHLKTCSSFQKIGRREKNSPRRN